MFDIDASLNNTNGKGLFGSTELNIKVKSIIIMKYFIVTNKNTKIIKNE